MSQKLHADQSTQRRVRKKYSYGKCWIGGGQLKSYKVRNKFSAETVVKESLGLRKARVSCQNPLQLFN